MRMKALKNFSCNGIKKKANEFLSLEETEAIGDVFGKELLRNDMVRVEPVEPVEESPVSVKAPAKAKKAKKTKK